MFNLSRQEKVVCLVIILVLLITFGWKLYQSEKDTITIIPVAEESTNVKSTEEELKPKICMVHIAGAVHHPGVYQLEEGKRIIDAVKMAGGEREEANLDAVNLAAILYDGQKIIIPMISENKEDMLTSVSETYEVSQQNMSSSGSSLALLNLNAATLPQLEALPGIGPVLAKRILDYRRMNGLFQYVEEVMNVTGIGEKKFEGIKELITVY